ncbi:mannose-P-dolichol utilization defect 1 protein [Rhizoclosmatium globosum]|uniref:Mannose-P-dolichol utilization defect 1 protein homolog n=1 Tax=Rhizoclosmatium globosum TaxID=329046 RepID=A0A1Y2CPA5_9FUNG|nr:mannose-P-dolichol utilization defect 1 protein [Rhizoclosmatium globosum]|eukprot:ORY48879.1 mannose-P-dolichol utilization defect 1 protein [Rhizoclosmatium globosum]
MAEQLSILLSPLVGDECASTLVTLALALNPELIKDKCFSLFISKGLGLGIIAGSSFVKVPQILKIHNSGSARGISLSSYVLETLALVITLGYNIRKENPFSPFAFVSIQNFIILLMLTSYSKSYTALVLITLFFAVSSYALFSDILPEEVLVYLTYAVQAPQIYTNFVNGNTGALSAITVFLQFIGAAARIFTTLREVKDQVILISFLVATTLNGILFAQVVFTGGAKKETGAAKAVGSKETKKGGSSKGKKNE